MTHMQTYLYHNIFRFEFSEEDARYSPFNYKCRGNEESLSNCSPFEAEEVCAEDADSAIAIICGGVDIRVSVNSREKLHAMHVALVANKHTCKIRRVYRSRIQIRIYITTHMGEVV